MQILDLSSLLDDTYDFHACLFGLEGLETFLPCIPLRGPPPHSIHSEYQGLATWATLDELRRIDLNELGYASDQRISKFKGRVELLRFDPSVEGVAPPEVSSIPPNQSLAIDEFVYRRGPETRRQALGPGFPVALDVMGVISVHWPEADVRLVFLFGNK